MIKAKEMSLIRISGASNHLKPVIDCLHDLKLLHIECHSGKDFFDIGKPFPEATQYSQLIVRARAMLAFFNLKAGNETLNDLVGAEKKFYEIEKEMQYFNESLRQLKEKKAGFERKIGNPLNLLGLRQNLYSGYKSVHVFSGISKKSVKAELGKKNFSNFELIEKPGGKDFAIALFVPLNEKDRFQGILAACNFSERNVPENVSIDFLGKELDSVNVKISFFEKKLAELKENNSDFLAAFECTLKKLNERAEAPLKFAQSRNAFIVSGWIPTESLKKLGEKVSIATNGKIFVEELHGNHDRAPVALDNPEIVRPFEFFLDLYALPKYYEIDPTFLLLLTFPLFFGFMLGDVGYGLVTLVLFLFLRSKIAKGARALLNIMIFASIASIFFGFVFGEFFGEEFIEHPLLNRVHDINGMMVISVLVGFIHVNLGLILGFYNKLKHHGLKHAVFEKGSWLLLELGAILIVGEMFLKLIPFGVIAGTLVVLVSLVLLYLGEGIKGFIELPSILSNMLSYMRLFAIGLSSVSLALVVNKMAGVFFEQGGLMIAVGILILVLGHVVNIALGILGPFLHALRLHYVEFFTKFFEGGGKKFSPFGD